MVVNEEKKCVETLSGRVPRGIPDRFRKTVPPGFKVGHCLAVAARLWMDLPEETRLQMLTGQFENSLVEIVRQIVDERIEAGRKAGQALAERRKRTPARKDSAGNDTARRPK